MTRRISYIAAGAGGLAVAAALGSDRPLHPVAVLAVIGLCAAYVAAAWRRDRPPRPPFLLPLAVLAISIALGVIVSGDLPLTLLAAWLAFAVVAVVAAGLAARPDGPALLLAVAAAAVGIVAAAALAAWLTGLQELQPFTVDSRGRLTWPFSHPNHLGAFFAVLLPLTLAAALGARTRLARVGTWCALALGAAALVASLSRTSWIAVTVGILLVALYGPGRRLVAIALPLAALAASPLLVARFTAADAGGDNVRFDIWSDALGMIAANPLTGVGLGRFSSEAEPLVAMPGAPRPEHGHNVLLDVAAESGLIAAVALLAILALSLLAAHRAARGGSPDVHLAAAGVAGGLAAMVVIGTLDQPFDDLRTAIACWFVIGAAAGLARHASEARDGDEVTGAPAGQGVHLMTEPGGAGR